MPRARFLPALTVAWLACACWGSALANASPAAPVIATWSRFRHAALSITFDDNSSGQFRKALPLLDAKGFAATFFVITGRMSREDWEIARRAASEGHEIGSHTVSHVVLSRESPARQADEMYASQRVIDSVIPFRKCLSLAYPYGDADAATEACARLRFVAARRVSTWNNPPSPPDYFAIGGRGPGGGLDAGEIAGWIRSAAAKGAWMVEVFHGIEDEGSDPVPAAWFARHLEDIARQQSEFWIAPFSIVAKYARERDCARVLPLGASDSVLRFDVRDSLPGSLYDQPLTIKVALPAGWKGASASQSGKRAWCQVLRESDGVYAEFEAIPDRGESRLRRTP